MAQGRYRFEDIAAITKETLQIIQKLIPQSVSKPATEHDALLLHRFPRYVYEELYNLVHLIERSPTSEFKELISQMTAIKNVCRSLDPSLNPESGEDLSPVVVEPSHLDLIRSLVNNLEFSLLGVILSRGQPSHVADTLGNLQPDKPKP